MSMASYQWCVGHLCSASYLASADTHTHTHTDTHTQTQVGYLSKADYGQSRQVQVGLNNVCGMRRHNFPVQLVHVLSHLTEC